MPQDMKFSTKVSGHTAKGMEIRGELLADLVAKNDFIGAFFKSLTGKDATAQEKTVLNSVLTACLDHGISPASGFVPRVSAASGNGVVTAMAAGLLALGPVHGAAITPAMYLIQELAQKNGDLAANAQEMISTARSNKQRLSGFGHPIYTQEDPRTTQLFDILAKEGFDLKFVAAARALETELEKNMGKKLVINIDGAVAVCLLTLGLDPEAGNGIFALARAAGSIAHIVEEIQAKGGVRRVPEEQISYQA